MRPVFFVRLERMVTIMKQQYMVILIHRILLRYMNLNQKMIKIRKKIPFLIRERYSEEVDYNFVKLGDIN